MTSGDRSVIIWSASSGFPLAVEMEFFMSARKTKPVSSAPFVARTPLGIEMYQPTRLDSVCKYTVGSFIAAGAAFAVVNVSASSASADESGGGFSDSSNGTFSFSDISLASGGVSDFSTFTPSLSDFAAPDPTDEVSGSTLASAPASNANGPASEIPQLSLGLTDLQPTDGTVEQTYPTGVLGPPGGLVSDDPESQAVAKQDFTPILASTEASTEVRSDADMGLSLDEGTVRSESPIDASGLASGLVNDDPKFASVLNEATDGGGLNELSGRAPELLLGDGSAFDFAGADLSTDSGIAGRVVPSDVLGLQTDLLLSDLVFATVVNEGGSMRAPGVDFNAAGGTPSSTLPLDAVASVGDLSQLGLNRSGNLDTPVSGVTNFDAATSDTTDLLLAATPPEGGDERSVWERMGQAINGAAILVNVLFPAFGLPAPKLPTVPPAEPTPVVEDRDKRGTDRERSGLEDATGDGPEGDPPPDPPTTGKQPPGGAPDPGGAPNVPFQLPEPGGSTATYSYSSYVAKPFVPEPESIPSSTQDATNQPVIFDSSFGKAPVWQPDPTAQNVPNAPAVSPNTETSWTQIAVPTKVMNEQTGNLFGYPMPAAPQPANATPTQSLPPAPVTTWSNFTAPTTPFVLDDSSSTFGEATPQPTKVTPVVASPPGPVQPQQRKTPDAGTAPLDPFINVPLDAAQQGLKWIFDSGVWGAVKVGEIGGSVISPIFGGWSTQP